MQLPSKQSVQNRLEELKEEQRHLRGLLKTIVFYEKFPAKESESQTPVSTPTKGSSTQKGL